MIRWLPMLLAACLAGVEPPVLLRTEGGDLAYDLAASSPWMPLLWDRCTLAMPVAQSGVHITAGVLVGGAGSRDATDQLALRDGHRLSLDGTTVNITGDDRHWSGTWSGGNDGSVLLINLPAHIDAAGVLLACRQICYANLGGARALPSRRIGIVINCDSVDSAMLFINVAPGTGDTAPMLRLDDIVMAMDETPAFRHQGWYDSRSPASSLTWQLTRIDDGLGVLGLTGLLAAGAQEHPLDFFTTGQLRLRAAQQGTRILNITCSDGGLSRTMTQAVAVSAPHDVLQVVGDFPFAVSGPADITFLTSDANTVLERCIEHPAAGTQDITNPFITLEHGHTLILRLTPPAEGASLDGCAVFSNGTATYRLPYRIRLNRTVAN